MKDELSLSSKYLHLNYSRCMDLPVQDCSLCGMVWYRTVRVTPGCVVAQRNVLHLCCHTAG